MYRTHSPCAHAPLLHGRHFRGRVANHPLAKQTLEGGAQSAVQGAVGKAVWGGMNKTVPSSYCRLQVPLATGWQWLGYRRPTPPPPQRCKCLPAASPPQAEQLNAGGTWRTH